MNKETRQILINQRTIMDALFHLSEFDLVELKLKTRIEETGELLNPKENDRDKKIKEALTHEEANQND